MRTTALAAALALAGCTTVGADGFADVAAQGELVEITKVGIGRSGGFTLAQLGAEGRFTRSAVSKGSNGELRHESTTRLAIGGSGEFAGLAAQCASNRESYEEVEELTSTTTLSAEIDTGPFYMTCGFFRGDDPIGGLEIRTEAGRAADPRNLRSGNADFGPVQLRIRSLHRYDATTIPSVAPVGYTMLLPGGGEAIVDLATAPRRIALPREGRDERAAALLTALALGLTWQAGG